MSFSIRPAKRENVLLLLGLAGGTGSGKTWTAMAIAKGMSGAKPFAVVDTENGRARHYADDFSFDVVDLEAPFTPDRYQQAIEACVKSGHKVIVVDSMSHEWEGVGGLLDWHEQEMGGQQSKNLSAWIKPKMAHRRLVTYLLQVDAHIILCLRAAEKVEAVRGANGKMEIVPKQTLTGLDGWVPITEKSLPFELTASFLLTADHPGMPKPIKLQEQHRRLIPLDKPLSEQTGAALAKWAAGDPAPKPASKGSGGGVHHEQIVSVSTVESPAVDVKDLTAELLALADRLGAGDKTLAAVTEHRAANSPEEHAVWLEKQIGLARDALSVREQA
jgi:hypothetical protein